MAKVIPPNSSNAITYYTAKDMVPIATVEHSGFERIAAELKSATTDLRSSRPMEPYLSLTLCSSDDEWILRSRCLQTACFPDDHTADMSAQGLRDALSAWDLPEERLLSFTPDNGANVVRATEVNTWTRLQCFGYRLHLAIDEAVKGQRVEWATGLCKKIVSAFSYSWKKKKALVKAQKVPNLPQHKVKTACVTRWGSMQIMTERVPEQKPLMEFTGSLSGEEYVTVSFVKPVLQILRSRALALEEDDTERPITEELLDMASFVDPRFKMTSPASHHVPTIKEKVKTETESAAVPQESTTGSAEPHTCPPEGKKPRMSLGNEATPSTTSTVSVQQTVEAELSSCLVSPMLDSEENPLDWWKKHHVNLPALRKVAKKFLCIPGTTSPPERVFSSGGNIVACLWSCLKPEKVNMLVFLAKNVE
ncbi:ZBED1 protein, partial [Atractosteus spatula]|nr:ZBED1 protein [Atractosteus spatula]